MYDCFISQCNSIHHRSEGCCHRLAPAVLLLIEETRSLICSFLRDLWGGRKGEGNVPSVRASTQLDTTVGTVRFCTLYT